MLSCVTLESQLLKDMTCISDKSFVIKFTMLMLVLIIFIYLLRYRDLPCQ